MGFALSTFYGSYVADALYAKASPYFSGARASELGTLQQVARNGGVAKPEMRIPALILASFFVPVGLLSVALDLLRLNVIH